MLYVESGFQDLRSRLTPDHGMQQAVLVAYSIDTIAVAQTY
jgi:hypothetical protein